MKNVVETKFDEEGFYYAFQGKRVNIQCKPMTYEWYEYVMKLATLKTMDMGLYAAKLTVARKFFIKKGEVSANILRHVEDVTRW